MVVPSQPSLVISQPQYRWKRGYVGHILEDDRMDFEYAKVFIRKHAPHVLDTDHTWTQQQTGAIKELTKLVLAEFPTFKKYDDHWPILYYARRNLYARRYRSKKQCQTRCCQCGLQHKTQCRREEAPAVCQSPATSTATLVSPSLQYVGLSRTARPHPSRRRSQRHVALPEVSASTAISGRAYVGLRLNYTVQRITQGEQEVLDFLKGLPTPLDALLHKFFVNGVTSKSRLRTMAQWSTSEKDKFLRELLLNRFERKVVMDGLLDIVEDI
ncbi:hypothetical protein C8Q78DRAFT_987357 [Trametes maxima]|nr:hypothetical protein C8Q78DRAFT_987357 [Trametes maxima]